MAIFDTRDARRAVSSTSPLRLEYLASIYDDAPSWKSQGDDTDGEKVVFTRDSKKLRRYNAEDCVRDARVAQGIQAEKDWNTPRVQRLYDVHVKLSKIAARMYRIGIPVDAKKRQALADQLMETYLQREKKVIKLVGVKGFRCTPNDMRKILYKRHESKLVRKFSLPDPIDPNMWVDQKMENISVDQSSLLLLISDPDCLAEIIPIVDAYWQAEGAWKARSTYVTSEKVQHAIGDDGRMRAGWNSCGTDTGRFSCSEPNLMNLSETKDEDGGALVGDLPNMRQMYWAGPGNVMVGADWSQLELRVMAAVSGDVVLEEALASGDVYSADARDIFPQLAGKSVEWIKSNAKAPRKSAKIVHLGFQYSAGTAALFKQALEQDRTMQFQALRLIHQAMMRRYAGTVRYWKDEHERVCSTGYSESRILQRRRTYPREPPPTETANYPIQSTASDIANLAMIRIERKLRRYAPKVNLVIQLHDAFYTIGPSKQERITREIVGEEMARPVVIGGIQRVMPVEIKSGTHWSEL